MKDNSYTNVAQKLLQEVRITDAEALWLYREATTEQLRDLAQVARRRFFAPEHATYVIMRIINQTNVCVALCDYCAFYQLPKSPQAYILKEQDIFAKLDELIQLGGEVVGFNGGFNPSLTIDWYASLFSRIKQIYGDRLTVYALTVAELMYIAKQSNLSYFQAACFLREAGVAWITGGGAEILTNQFRKRHSPLKFTADEFVFAHREIIRAGVGTTATMVIGFDETFEERVEHLGRVREIQDETGGLTSFLTWTYKPWSTKLGGKEIESEQYLRHLAVCRIYLDNITHIRTSVLTQNENALVGLQFGADDFDIPLEDEVTEKAGARIERDLNVVINCAHALGYAPQRRKPWISSVRQ